MIVPVLLLGFIFPAYATERLPYAVNGWAFRIGGVLVAAALRLRRLFDLPELRPETPDLAPTLQRAAWRSCRRFNYSFSICNQQSMFA